MMMIMTKYYRALWFIIHLLYIHALSCGPGYKPSLNSSVCVDLTNRDVLGAIHWLAYPPSYPNECNSLVKVQGITICEDFLPNPIISSDSTNNIISGSNGTNICNVVSFIATTWCDHYGSLEFEMYWVNRGCNVTIYHYHVFFKGNTCNNEEKLKKIKGLTIIKGDMWAAKCFNCLYKALQLPATGRIDILKIQEREGVNEDFDGTQYTVVSDLYRYAMKFVPHIRQIVFRSPINANTLVDTVGREGEHAWNMWGTQQFLLHYGTIHSDSHRGRDQPFQFSHLLQKVKVSTEFSSYLHTFILLTDSKTDRKKDSKATLDEITINKNKEAALLWQPEYVAPLKAVVPLYCKTPTKEEDEIMQDWIKQEMNVRCHLTRLAVPCDRSRPYDAIIPCEQELIDKLADDYASSKGWCDFTDKNADIIELVRVDPRASKAFQVTSKPMAGVRLAFFFTVYRDAAYMRRLLTRLYSSDHYYLIHIDAAGATAEFTAEIRSLAESYPAKNVYTAKDIPIVYGASTATILLTKAMAWFLRHASGWDYFVPVTGSDYPLIPLYRMEKIFAFQQPPMPFIMAWTAGTSTHIFRLQKTHPIFDDDPLLALSIKAVSDERGKILGQVPMEYRSTNFGPPLFCNGKSSFYHLDNRGNKSARIYDTQWLFPRDRFPGRGRAYAEHDPNHPIYPYDGVRDFTYDVFRVWKKSDPATTGAYDRETIDYIVNSVEGKKYFHFFQHMLLGSEEHYYVSLLYNWERTRAFVQTLSAQTVWNTWTLGLWEVSGGGFQTHTHFLTMNEWEIIEGFSKRGMMFARKFSTSKTSMLLDAIDEFVHFNKSTIAGLYWPGFFPTDITTPGKLWVGMLHRNITLRRQGKLPPYEFPETVREIEANNPSSVPRIKERKRDRSIASLGKKGKGKSREAAIGGQGGNIKKGIGGNIDTEGTEESSTD